MSLDGSELGFSSPRHALSVLVMTLVTKITRGAVGHKRPLQKPHGRARPARPLPLVSAHLAGPGGQGALPVSQMRKLKLRGFSLLMASHAEERVGLSFTSKFSTASPALSAAPQGLPEAFPCSDI